MPANEIENRLAAAGWIRFSDSAPDGLSLRSQVSCQNRLIVTAATAASNDFSFDEMPLIIVPLDRTLSRRETSVLVTKLETVDAEGSSYPDSFEGPYGTGLGGTVVAPPDTRIIVEPLHLDWIGDVTNPSWLPFGLGFAGDVDPTVFDLDLYNAVAFLGPILADGEPPVTSDFCFVIFQHPMVEGETLIEDTIAIDAPA